MSDPRYGRQLRRLWWAKIRVAAIELRDARERWKDRDPCAPERILRFREQDLIAAEQEWEAAWDELAGLRARYD